MPLAIANIRNVEDAAILHGRKTASTILSPPTGTSPARFPERHRSITVCVSCLVNPPPDTVQLYHPPPSTAP